MRLSPKDVPEWHAYKEGTAWGVTNGKKILWPLTEIEATMIASASMMFRFLYLCYRPNRPLTADLDTLFSRMGVEVDYSDGTKKDSEA